jgi:hypothetical protein
LQNTIRFIGFVLFRTYFLLRALLTSRSKLQTSQIVCLAVEEQHGYLQHQEPLPTSTADPFFCPVLQRHDRYSPAP